ncbi:MAG TPA: hypothetical protein VGG33_21840, partial [Polyangia bacterium]
MDVNPADGSFAESSVAAFTRSRAAFDLKGVMSSLTVLRLRSRDLNLIERQLRAKVMQFPQFFHNSPIVLDVSEIEGGIAGFPLAALVRALHVCKVVPVAVTNIDDANRPMAAAAGLGVVSLSAAKPGVDPEAAAEAQTRGPRAEATANATEAAPHTPPPRAAVHHEAESGGRNHDRHGGQHQDAPPARTQHNGGHPHAHHNGGHHSNGLQAPTHQGQGQTHQTYVGHHPNGGGNANGNGHTNAAVHQPSPTPPRGTPLPGAHRAPLVVRQPVRSGQLIYAENNDLIV